MTGEVAAPPGQLRLVVHETSVLKTRDDDAGPWTRTVVYMNVTLANGEGSAAVPTNFALFTVETDAGLRKQADADAIVDRGGVVCQARDFVTGLGCDPALAIAGGASLNCSLAASFDGDFSPSRIIYMTPGALAESQGVSASHDKRTASSALNPPTCTACGTLCTNIDVDARHCGSCGTTVPNDARCDNGVPTCNDDHPDLCTTADGRGLCTDLKTDARNCGSCGTTAPSEGVCENGIPSCTSEHPDVCTTGGGRSLCTDLKTDARNCGSCGNAVRGDGLGSDQNIECIDGQPGCANGLTFCQYADSSFGYCADLANDPENCGACGHFVEAESCSHGGPSCGTEELACDGGCVYRLDRLHCGSCTKRCDEAADDWCFDASPELNGQSEYCVGIVEVSSENDPCQVACVAAGYQNCVLIDDGFGPECYRPGAVVDCACRY